MPRMPLKSGSVLALLLTLCGTAAATPFGTLTSVASGYNVFLLGNLGTSSQAYGADAQGEVAVAGNAYFNGASVNANNVGPNALIVGGNLAQAGGTDYGNVFVEGASANFSGGATVNGSVSVTAAHSSLAFGNASTPTGFYVTPTTSVSVPSYMSGAVHTSGGPAPPLDLYGTSTDLANASTQLAALSATHVSSSGGTITLTLTQSGLNVIDLSVANGATITGVTVNAAPGVNPTGLVVNLSGNNLTFNGGTFLLGPLSKNSVLFNFDNATALTLESLAFEGSLLAPSATVDFVSGDIDGALMADNYLGGGEFHEAALALTLPGQAGSSLSTEPRSIAILGAGIVAIGLALRRTRDGVSP